MAIPQPKLEEFRWLRCHSCGSERLLTASVPQCAVCGGWDLHIHSNVDGEQPTRLKRHHPGCGNQNAVTWAGAYLGAADCPVCKDWK